MDFKLFKNAVAQSFALISKSDKVFRTSVSKDQLWETYLSSFPEGSNPIFRERTTHDCNCCKQFIRAVGDVVGVVDGALVSIWDIQINDPEYQAVADAMSHVVKAHPIENFFVHFEAKAGTDKTFEEMTSGVHTWDHFHVNIPAKFVKRGSDIPSFLGEVKSTFDVLRRSLGELTKESLDVVLELISQNTLYRGEEHKFAVSSFKSIKQQYDVISKHGGGDEFIWGIVQELPASVTRIRNTVIGTLLVDISEGTLDLEQAVKSYEVKVAPTNYKRPTALITKSMIENAQAKVEELGLVSALERRYATLSDITVNNILFANRDSKKVMTGNVFDELASKANTSPLKSLDTIEEISIDKFISEVLPKAESLELLVEGRLTGNFVSLVSPVDPTAGKLFKWDNNFSWSYKGEVTDSIKERVKQAGGNVSGDLCCRLAWYNSDDLDLHMLTPGGSEICFSNKRPNGTSGILDVDMNAHIISDNPVENIYFPEKKYMREGLYILRVHNFRKRESVKGGFEVDIDFMGDVRHFETKDHLRDNGVITVAEFNYSHARGIEYVKSMPFSANSKDVWGVSTQTFQKVNVVMLSPNYWNDLAVGNKHYFFMLDGCVNKESTRGFYNEFLSSELEPHRKVFEVVGSKMKTAESIDQLSGLGFSSTQRNSVVCRVSGSFTRTLKINF